MRDNGTLITGISGFVGSNLAPYLHQHEIGEITGLIRKESVVPEGVKNSTVSLVTDTQLTNNQYTNYIHLAGKAHDLKGVSDEQSYFDVNYGMTKRLFDRFLEDEAAERFIFMSSVKAVSDSPEGVLDERAEPKPITAYGRSKLKAEEYVLENCPPEKQVYVLRPCMIHGPGNKGNLNLLYSLVSKGIPWPLGRYENSRSFLSVENLCFVIDQILEGEVESGVYHVADDGGLSTTELISIIAEVSNKKARIWNVPKQLIQMTAKVGNILPLPLNEERLEKLTEDYVVSNEKLKKALGIERMPISAKEGMVKTLKDFDG